MPNDHNLSPEEHRRRYEEAIAGTGIRETAAIVIAELHRLVDACGRERLETFSAYVIEHYSKKEALRADIQRLTDRVALRLRELLSRLETAPTVVVHQNGMFIADACNADFAESLGRPEVAHDLREEARARWAAYLADQDLSRVRDGWVDEASQEHVLGWLVPHEWSLIASAIAQDNDASVPALSYSVLSVVIRAHLDWGRRVVASGSGWAIVNRSGAEVATMDPAWAGSADLETVRGLLAASEGLTAHRLFRWVVNMAHAQAFARASADYGVLRVPGGLSGLAQTLGLTSKRAPQDLKNILHFFQRALVLLPKGERAGLLSWSSTMEAPGRRSELSIEVHEALLPHYVNRLPKGPHARRLARMLVPIPATLPPLPHHPAHHAAMARLHLLLLMEIRHHARSMFEAGAVPIPAARWMRLSRDAGVPEPVLPLVLQAWAASGREGAFLGQIETDFDYWTLTPVYAREKRCIEAAGRSERHGSNRQRKGSRARDRLRTDEG